MKKRFGAIISVFGVMVSASMAQITNPVPYADTFENDKYAVGSNLVGTVWQGDTNDASAVVTNLSCTSIVGYPVTNATHDQVLAFSAGVPITNEFNAAGLAVVALDTMIKPTFSERPEGSQMAAVSNSQMSLYIGTNELVNIWHGTGTGWGAPSPSQVQWSEFSQLNVSSGSWVRLTVTLNYLYDDDSGSYSVMMKTAINGQVLTNSLGHSTPSPGVADGGPWFQAASWNNADARLHRVVLSGLALIHI